MVLAWTYAIAVNFVPAYRDTVDKVGESSVGLGDGDAGGSGDGEAKNEVEYLENLEAKNTP